MRHSQILVVGGGIAGLAAALEAAEVGHDVVLVEKGPHLGGRVAALNKYFPKLCPPYCGLEMDFRRLRGNSRLRTYTLTHVQHISGHAGDFEVALRQEPRYVLEERCTACGKCLAVCPVERPDQFNQGMGRTKAVYPPHDLSFPMTYAIDPEVCLGPQCARCVSACPYGAIDLGMVPREVTLPAAAIVLAPGWRPYDASRLDLLGFGRYPNVITNVMMERLAAPNGPTQGRIVRPGDAREVKAVAFVQCAGSRDEAHLPYCSTVCCLTSLKQALYVRDWKPQAMVYIFYMDIRTPGFYEDFYRRLRADAGMSFVRGKVGQVRAGGDGDLVVEAEDTVAGKKVEVKVDMVVLATGMVPATEGLNVPGLERDKYGFLVGLPPGVSAAGVALRPMDVASSVRTGTGAALKALQAARRP